MLWTGRVCSSGSSLSTARPRAAPAPQSQKGLSGAPGSSQAGLPPLSGGMAKLFPLTFRLLPVRLTGQQGPTPRIPSGTGNSLPVAIPMVVTFFMTFRSDQLPGNCAHECLDLLGVSPRPSHKKLHSGPQGLWSCAPHPPGCQKPCPSCTGALRTWSSRQPPPRPSLSRSAPPLGALEHD